MRGTVPPVFRHHFYNYIAFPCSMRTVEVLPHFSRDYTIRDTAATLSPAKGKMKRTTSGANDALADFPKLPQEGGTVSRLQCGSRSSPSAQVAEDRNSYASGATRKLSSSFRVCQGKRSSPGPGSRMKVLLKQERCHDALPITHSTIQGGVKTEDNS